jgi:hypothetical protein
MLSIMALYYMIMTALAVNSFHLDKTHIGKTSIIENSTEVDNKQKKISFDKSPNIKSYLIFMLYNTKKLKYEITRSAKTKLYILFHKVNDLC